MTKISEILTIDLHEDIKNVIDLEDQSENEVQQELESYIVTQGLGEHYYHFFSCFTDNMKETGVWLSGFYGSGKSYFGKMLGYILANPVINGTSARERFILRLKGLKNESLLENIIRKLDSVQSRVVCLDVAKQNTEKGLAFTLFANFLKNLGFRQDIYGYIEFDLFLENKYEEFCRKVHEIEGKDWRELRANNRAVAKTMRNAHIAMGYSEKEYEETRETYSNAINDFSASRLKDELEKYLKVKPDETLVFVFDEASEAISQKKFTLLDLEGLSEIISSISKTVWLIAIAQEKLEDVINNANVNRSQLTKVTDRFKTKIHLESTEVDVIIRSRLLQKKDKFNKELLDYYKQNEGLITDSTNLNSSFPTKTTRADEFAIYYPFHKYQFQILQKFLFSSNALVATQIAARGMIITTFDVLRKQMREQNLFNFATGYAVCTEAQTAPPVDLVNKYDTAAQILRESRSSIDGEKLLKTIHLLADSEVVAASAENITKSYISDIAAYYNVKPEIEKALEVLVEAKVLLFANNHYKITSDLEGRLLEEMKDFTVELFAKKRDLIKAVKEYKLFSAVASYNDNNDSFKFSIASDQDDELASGNKQLNLKVYSLFNIGDSRQDLIERIKLDTQSQKDLISLVPDNSEFAVIDKLIGEISRYSYMESKYANESKPEIRQIIRDFAIIREEKEKDLRHRIENAYLNSTLIYMFDVNLLNPDTFKASITELQKKVVRNIFTKRLGAQLSENLVPKVFSSRKDDLAKLFPGDEFKFFDANGNFVGDHLKVVEEITAKIKTRYLSGRDLESELSGAPWAYSFGTIVVTLAALLRAGKLAVKHGGNEPFFSHQDKAVHDAFTNATRFKSASFKAVTATLGTAQKNQAVQCLIDLEIQQHTGRKIDWNNSDFDVADAIRFMAEHFLGAMKVLDETIDGFAELFPAVAEQKKVLQSFAAKVTESNYIEKVEHFLGNSDEFKKAIDIILKAQKFIKKNFNTVKKYERFFEELTAILKKADTAEQTVADAYEEFNRLCSQDMVKNYSQLQQQAQLAKDAYYKLLKNAAGRMSHEYQLLQGKVDGALRRLKKDFPQNLNRENARKLEELKRYCSDRIIAEPVIEFETSCRNSGYSLPDMLNYTALLPAKESDLLIIESGFVPTPPPEEKQPDSETAPVPIPVKAVQPRKIQFQVPGKFMTVQEYKQLLTAQLTALAAAKPDEKIEIEITID